jgi:hypothetical protein
MIYIYELKSPPEKTTTTKQSRKSFNSLCVLTFLFGNSISKRNFKKTERLIV